MFWWGRLFWWGHVLLTPLNIHCVTLIRAVIYKRTPFIRAPLKMNFRPLRTHPLINLSCFDDFYGFLSQLFMKRFSGGPSRVQKLHFKIVDFIPQKDLKNRSCQIGSKLNFLSRETLEFDVFSHISSHSSKI